MPSCVLRRIFYGSEGFQRRGGGDNQRGHCTFNPETKRLPIRMGRASTTPPWPPIGVSVTLDALLHRESTD